MSRLVRAALIVGVLAVVFAPGATQSDTSSVEPTDLVAAVLAPTTLELAVTRTVAPRPTDLIGLQLLSLAVVAVAFALSHWSRRRRELQAPAHATPAEASRPHRRGPPLLAV